jgi:hypothetical protein
VACIARMSEHLSRDRPKDCIGRLGRDEWLGVFMVNEGGGIGVELIDAAIEAALDRLVGEQRNQLGVK